MKKQYLFSTVLLLLFIIFTEPLFSQADSSNPFYKGTENSSVSKSISVKPNSFIEKISVIQKTINRRISTVITDYRTEKNLHLLIYIAGFAFIYGLIHAMTPGHGKNIILAWIMTSEKTFIKVLLTAVTGMFFHVFNSVVMVYLIWYLIKGKISVPVHLVSAFNDSGLSELTPYLVHGRTSVMVGSSGTGKSTLINRLCGETVQATGEVSASVGKGTHTTTSRDLIMMPQGGMIIDNPGIREISFWEIDQGVESTFPEIEEFAAGCRFSDCTHAHEPGCRGLQAVQDGELTEARLENYLKMKRELEYISARKNKSADRVEKERWRDVSMKIKSINKKKTFE